MQSLFLSSLFLIRFRDQELSKNLAFEYFNVVFVYISIHALISFAIFSVCQSALIVFNFYFVQLVSIRIPIVKLHQLNYCVNVRVLTLKVIRHLNREILQVIFICLFLFTIRLEAATTFHVTEDFV